MIKHTEKNSYLLYENISVAFLQQHLTAFLDVVYSCGLKKTMQLDNYLNVIFLMWGAHL